MVIEINTMRILKTEKQITKKIESLKKKLSKKKAIYENFGDKEQDKLDDFIGNVYDYDSLSRMRVYDLIEDFADWCETYTILEK